MRRHVGWGVVAVIFGSALACTVVPDAPDGSGGSTGSSSGQSMTTSGTMSTSSGNSTSSGSAGNVCLFDDINSTFDNCDFGE